MISSARTVRATSEEIVARASPTPVRSMRSARPSGVLTHRPRLMASVRPVTGIAMVWSPAGMVGAGRRSGSVRASAAARAAADWSAPVTAANSCTWGSAARSTPTSGSPLASGEPAKAETAELTTGWISTLGGRPAQPVAVDHRQRRGDPGARRDRRVEGDLHRRLVEGGLLQAAAVSADEDQQAARGRDEPGREHPQQGPPHGHRHGHLGDRSPAPRPRRPRAGRRTGARVGRRGDRSPAPRPGWH